MMLKCAVRVAVIGAILYAEDPMTPTQITACCRLAKEATGREMLTVRTPMDTAKCYVETPDTTTTTPATSTFLTPPAARTGPSEAYYWIGKN